jgi:hypothetical protein
MRNNSFTATHKKIAIDLTGLESLFKPKWGFIFITFWGFLEESVQFMSL